MSDQLTFEIRPNGGALEITLRAEGLQVAQAAYQRSIPAIAAGQLESFRTGDASPADIAILEKSLSDWLLDSDLRPLLGQLVEQHRLRFVFTFDNRVQNDLDDLPFELIRTNAAADPIVVHPNVENFVYRLSTAGAPAPTGVLDWPMRILLIRSNPGDLGGEVPLGAPIRDRILDLGKRQFGPNNVLVDLLSSEPGSLGGPTWETFKTMAKSEYDVLVYLGHGDIQKIHNDLPAVAQLQFESSNPQYHEPIASKRLATFLADNPIPAVVLAGCLSAAAPTTPSAANLATWMRGNQGMAQALVNSASGVMFAVGMRCKVEDDDALDFISAFFENLFSRDLGNLERAVRAGRRELFGKKPDSSCWAAPVVFSSLPKEPVFEYLARVPFPMTPEMTRELDIRRMLWNMMSAIPVGQRQDALKVAIAANRQAFEDEVTKKGALMIPEQADAAPSQGVSIPITLKGLLACKYLQARIATATDLKIAAVRATDLLRSAGFRVLSDASEGVFHIHQRDVHKPASSLPTGHLLDVDVDVSANASRICPLNLELIMTDATQPLWLGTNAVIVPPLV